VQANEEEQISLNTVMRLWFHKTSHYMQLMQLSMSLHSLSLHLSKPPVQYFAQHPQSQNFFPTILCGHILKLQNWSYYAHMFWHIHRL